MLIDVQELFQNALRSGASDRSLWEIAAHLLDDGTSHETLSNELEALALRLRNQGCEADEERVMDVMDGVIGWCGPGWSLVSRGR
jgi:hypothetical protein